MEITVHLGAALINMYARCGSIKESRRVFDGIPERDLISWTAIICGYGMHRLAEDAELLFRSDGVTFMGLLMGFSHKGLVQKGQQYYGRMIQQYGFKPALEHHSSMVDKLGRAGRLDEAEEFTGNMDVEPDASILRIDPGYPGWYVLMSNIYAFARCWDGVARMRLLMKENRISKPPGWSSIEIGGQMHTFLAFDKLHPRSNEIYKFLKDLEKRMRIEHYVPEIKCVLSKLDEEHKEDMLRGHSERLAIAFGILGTGDGEVLRVIKNLRVCVDCHTATQVHK
ncbi:pentatricopeptide repeat-containing protein At3g26782, mitochondrial-like [Musa acuminata AAA Group]|uniref:pentatricopeptide repeat-containing protein At3g26782, mitochondrial-like n=1 Tax=Musa acuminata AAA Group TaxID=214697 RepID=UPI0031DFDA95